MQGGSRFTLRHRRRTDLECLELVELLDPLHYPRVPAGLRARADRLHLLPAPQPTRGRRGLPP